MDVNKVLYISQEINPYINTNPLASFSCDLPQAIQGKGAEVRTFMPRYGGINERRNQLHEVIRLSGMNIIIDDTDHPLIIKVATLLPTRMQVYFIDNDDYFMRHTGDGLETVIIPENNDERTIFFVRGVVETVKKLRWDPAVVHCTGWITALAPLYLKHVYNEDPSFRESKIVYSLYDYPLEGELDSRMLEKLKAEGFSDAQLSTLVDGDDKIDCIKLNKIAIDYADAVTQASDNIPEELVEYAKASGKPFLPYSGENCADEYFEFYKSL